MTMQAVEEHLSARASVRVSEALTRIVAYQHAAERLYVDGEVRDAATIATRPIAEILPWLQNELTGHGTLVRDLVQAVAAVPGALRGSAPPRTVALAVDRSTRLIRDIEQHLLGDAVHRVEHRATIVVALLERARRHYGEALDSGLLRDYHDAHALTAEALKRLASLQEREPGLASDAVYRATALLLRAAGGSRPPLEPPAVGDFDGAVREVRVHMERHASAMQVEGGPADALFAVAGLVDDIEAAYAGGRPELAARLAATAYLLHLLPFEERLEQLFGGDAARLASILRAELRVAIDRRAGAEAISALCRSATDLAALLLERAEPVLLP